VSGLRRVYCEATSKSFEVPDSLERIVSLSPAVTETLFMLGLEDRIVGVSAFDVHPEKARKKPVLGSYSTTNTEKLASLKPQLVFLTTGYQRELALKLSEKFAVYAVELPVTVASIVDMVVKIGLVVGEAEAARALEKKLIQQTFELKTGVNKRVYVEIDLGGPVTFGAYSYITDALSLIGAENIFSDHYCEWEAPDFELVKKSRPDAIIYEAKMFRRLSVEEVCKKFLERGWAELCPIKNKRIFVTPGPYDLIAHHGPSFILEALPWMHRALATQE